nr:zinc finger, CCHC-type [Tanacetum cinerariifolium]
MSVVYVLTTLILEDGGDDATIKQIRKRAMWDNDDYVCRGLILNGMSEPLFDIYQNVESFKEPWDTLEAKYMTEDTSNLKHTLKHKKDELTLVELDSHMRIEESLKGLGLYGSYKTPLSKAETLGERGIECIFIGYAERFKAFRFYVTKPNDSVLINSIIKSRDAIFDKNRFSSVLRPSLRIPNGTKDIGGSVVFEEDEVCDQHSYCFNDEDDLKIFDEAMKSQDVAFWKEAINDEMDSIMGNNTWLLADLPPVIHHMDVKTAFLNGKLDEEVYMNQPQGFIMPGNENKVCKMIKSLYGLKHAHKQWHQKFDEVVLSNGFLLNQSEKCVYSKFDKTDKGVIICLYIDDMLIFGTDQVQVDMRKEFLSSMFSMKDMGEADVILGIQEANLHHWFNNEILICGSNKSCAAPLAKAYRQMYNEKSRHLGIRHSMIHELITNGVVSIKFVRSQQNLTGHLMKGLAKDLVIKSVEVLSTEVTSIPAQFTHNKSNTMPCTSHGLHHEANYPSILKLRYNLTIIRHQLLTCIPRSTNWSAIKVIEFL